MTIATIARQYFRKLLSAGIVFSIAMSLHAQDTLLPNHATLATSDVRLQFHAGANAPNLIRLSAKARSTLRNRCAETLPSSVKANGATLNLTWKLSRTLSHADANQVVYVYESTPPHLRLSWIWDARAHFGPIEHRISIENLSEQAVWLPLLDSLRLKWDMPDAKPLRNFYVEKGADSPSAQGTHTEDLVDQYSWTGKSSTYAFPAPGEAREIIPAEFIFEKDQPQNGWYAGIEFSGRTRIALERNNGHLKTEVGLDPVPGPFRTRLKPGEKFETPTVFLGAFTGGPDGAGNQLRPWVRAVLGNPVTWRDPQYPLTVNNSWGSGTQVDEQLAQRMIAESKELGLEMFHIDAGWFRGVGDWYPDPRKFPHGLAPIADAAHRQGLRFGIWVDWTQAGLDTLPGALNVHDPKVRGWMVTDVGPEWKPEEFKGQTIDLGVPAAREYLGNEVNRIVEDYHLDMLEHDGYLVAKGCTRADHPHAPPDRSTMKVIHDWGSDFVLASNSTDVSYHAVSAYYSIYQQTRQKHPGLLFEICNDGGRMVDFGSAAHGDYFSITDTYDPLSNRRAFFDTSHELPAAMLESYVEKWPTPRPENFLYMLRSGMMGWVTIMLDTTAWTREQHQAAQEAIALYKSKLRPLIRDANLFHISDRPDGVHWDGMEYWNPKAGNGAVFVFRGTIQDETEHTFVLAGLNPTKLYKLHFNDDPARDEVKFGRQLIEHGLSVHLQNPLSSELIFMTDLATDK